jgi:hypothetical protein
MTFLQPFILWGLPLLLIPIIIHLLNRLRHRPQPWGAMRFLRSANQSSISQAKLRQLLVLFFRVLAVVALIFFLSRPLAGGWLGWALSSAPEVVVLILDRSASMETLAGATGKTRREEAIRLWRDALQPFKSSRLVLLDSALQTPQELPGAASLSLPQFTGATDTRADIPALLQRAYSYLAESRSGGAEIWIASDLQESNWSPDDSQWEKITQQFAALPQKVRFRLLSFEEPSARNVTVSLQEAVRRSRAESRQLTVVVDLQQSTNLADPVVLRWNMGGSSSQADITIPGQSLRWRNNFSLPNVNELGWGLIEIGADANPSDNKLFFAYGAETLPATLIVSSAPPAATRPLQLAGSDLSRPVEDWARVVSPENFASQPLTNIGLIVWQAPVISGAAPAILNEFVNSGGTLFVLAQAGGPISFAGLSYGEITQAPTNSSFTIAQWNELEGPLARTEEGFGVPLRELEVFRRAAIAGTGGTLATFSDGAPLLMRKAQGKGEIYFCATSTEPGWSTLDDGAVLVPMMQRMLAGGARRVNAALMMECGDTATTDATEWSRVDESIPSEPRFQAGVYRVDGRFVAVNRPAVENDPHRISPEVARGLFRDVPFRMHEERAATSDRLQGEIWRIFLTFMLIFLMVEGFLVLPASGVESVGKRPSNRKPAEVPA